MTSIEWLIQQIENKGSAWEKDSIKRIQISIKVSEYLELKRQAKEMHKQEIIDAWDDGIDSFSTRNAEVYYNEAFKNQQQPKTTQLPGINPDEVKPSDPQMVKETFKNKQQ
jgi:hypothetical protein